LGGSEEAGREEVVGSRPAAEKALRSDWRLLELIHWLRKKLQTLHMMADDEYLRANLHVLICACDPDTNPRLRSCVEDLDHPSHPEGG
jgi:hypothetical protein